MIATLVDANVIIDIVSEDSHWADWSSWQLGEASGRGHVVINPVIYAELAAGYDSLEELDDAVPATFYHRAALPWESAFLASKVFQMYRRRGGSRSAVLPDFFIGAHAAVADMTLLTRDARRYRTYFPKLRIISP